MAEEKMQYTLSVDYSDLETASKGITKGFKGIEISSKSMASGIGGVGNSATIAGQQLNSGLGGNGTNGVKKLNNEIDRGTSKTKGFVSELGNLAKNGLMFMGLGKVFGMITGSMDSAISRLDTMNNYGNMMANMNIGAEESAQSIERLKDGLDGLPTKLDDAVSSVAMFTSANKNIQGSTEMYLALNNAVLAGGASQQAQASAVEQLSQAYLKGKPDMMEWRTAMMAMPAQLDQTAKAMGLMSSNDLGESLRNGNISMQEFMNTLMQLNTTGLDGFLSFEQQARNSTGGAATSIANMRNAFTRGIADIMNTIGQSTIASFFGTIASAVNTATAYIVAFINVLKTAISFVGGLFGKTTNSAKETQKATTSVGTSVGSIADNTGGMTKGFDNAGKAAKNTAKEVKKLSQIGIDELNVLSKQDIVKDDGSGLAGGGSGGGIEMPDFGSFDFDKFNNNLDKSNSKAKKIYDDMMRMIGKFNFYPLISAWKDMWSAVKPISDTFGKAMRYILDKILFPLASFTISTLLPSFLHLLAGAFRVLDPLLKAFSSIGKWLLESWLIPLGKITLAIVIGSLKTLTFVLITIGNWMSRNQSVVTAMTAVVVTFFAAWQVAKLVSFVNASGGVLGALNKMTGATKLLTKVKNSEIVVSTRLGALWLAEKMAALAGAAAIKLETTAYKLKAYAMDKTTGQTIAITVAQKGAAVASNALTAAVGFLRTAMNLLSGPVGWVIAGLTALVGIGAVMWFNNTKNGVTGLTKEQQALNSVLKESVDGINNVETPLSRLADESLPKVKNNYMAVNRALAENKLNLNTESLDNVATSTETMYKDVLSIIDENTGLMYNGLSDYYERSNVLTSEREQDLLNQVLTNGQTQKEETQKHYDAMTSIVETAKAEGRDLNAQEQLDYQEHLYALNKIALETITPEQARQLGALEQLNVDKLAADKEYRKEYADLIVSSNAENTKTMQEKYGYDLALLKKTKETTNMSEEEYNRQLKAIQDGMYTEQKNMLEKSVSDAFTRITGANESQLKEYMSYEAEYNRLLEAHDNATDEMQKSVLSSQMAAIREKQTNLGIEKSDINTFNSFLEELPSEYKGIYQQMNSSMSLQDGINQVNGQYGSAENAGRQVANGMNDGVQNGQSSVINSIGRLASNMISKAKGILGIHSPSRVFKGIGLFTTDGFADGIEDGSKDVIGAMEDTTKGLIGASKVDLSKGITMPSPELFKPMEFTAKSGEFDNYDYMQVNRNSLSSIVDDRNDQTNKILLMEQQETNQLLRELVEKDSNIYLDTEKVNKGLDKEKEMKARQRGQGY